MRREREWWFHSRCRADLGDRLGGRRGSVLAGQHEHRKLPRGLGLVFAKGGILRDQFWPQRGAGGAGEFVGQVGERLGTHLHGDRRVGLEVVVPVWVGGRSSAGGDDHETAAWLGGAAQRGNALDPGPGADVVDEDQRGARPGPADASLVRPELLDDLGVIVAALSRSWLRHESPPRARHWLSYSSWRRIQSWNPSPSSRPFGARSR